MRSLLEQPNKNVIFYDDSREGCTAPIGALLRPTKDGWHFKGGVFSLDGTEKAVYENYFSKEAWEQIGEQAAQAVLKNGGAAIMSELKTK